MKPETEKLLGTLELIIDKLYIDLPGHEHGENTNSFVWEKEALGKCRDGYSPANYRSRYKIPSKFSR